MNEKLQIKKLPKMNKTGKYVMLSVRINAGTAQRIEQIAKETNRSRNKVLNMMLEFGIERCEVTE